MYFKGFFFFNLLVLLEFLKYYRMSVTFCGNPEPYRLFGSALSINIISGLFTVDAKVCRDPPNCCSQNLDAVNSNLCPSSLWGREKQQSKMAPCLFDCYEPSKGPQSQKAKVFIVRLSSLWDAMLHWQARFRLRPGKVWEDKKKITITTWEEKAV